MSAATRGVSTSRVEMNWTGGPWVAAAERGFGVLHYDHGFDRLAEVLSFTSQWIAPPGSVD